jgi:signal peptidase I
MSDEAPAQPDFKKSVGREYLESVVVAVILALFIRTFAVQAFKIPSGSMIPTLLIGDHLLVNKLVYSPSSGPLESALLGKKDIQRGHVVVFKYPDDPTRDFIKRVVGLPGEKVEIRDKRVYIDDKPLEESAYAHFLQPPLHHDDPEYGLRDDGPRDNMTARLVPEGQLFVMGDNRDNSRDSRFWGFLPIDQVKGRALLVYWSWTSTHDDYEHTGVWAFLKDLAHVVWDFKKGTRWDRFFHMIR